MLQIDTPPVGNFWRRHWYWYVCVRGCVVAPYVKVYLMDGKTCVEKQKTMTARRTLDPLYQQQLCFTMPYNGKILQVRLTAVREVWTLGFGGITLPSFSFLPSSPPRLRYRSSPLHRRSLPSCFRSLRNRPP